nr:hypothetical protein [Armatimonas sp.]
MPDRYDQPDATLLAEIRARLTNATRLGLGTATTTALTTADSA